MIAKTYYYSAISLVLVAGYGCGASVLPGSDTGQPQDVPIDIHDTSIDQIDVGPMDAGPLDAGHCVLPNGLLCAVGQTCPAGDGCNSCSCTPSLQALCTEIACHDSGPRRCSSTNPCPANSNTECVYQPGCSQTGSCEPVLFCSEPIPYCGCDGQTYLACQPTQPLRHTGQCQTTQECMLSTDCNSRPSPGTTAFCQSSSWSCIAGRCTWECMGGRTCMQLPDGCMDCGTSPPPECPGTRCFSAVTSPDIMIEDAQCSRPLISEVQTCFSQWARLRDGTICSVQELPTGALRWNLQCGPCQTTFSP